MSAVSYSSCNGLLWRGLRTDGVLVHQSGWARHLVGVVLASTVMAGVTLWLGMPWNDWLQKDLIHKGLDLAVAIVAGGLCYGLLLLVFRVPLAVLREPGN